MTSREKDRSRLAALGETLRAGVTVPTDTYITEDIPLLLTRLSQVGRTPPVLRPVRGRHDDGEAISPKDGS